MSSLAFLITVVAIVGLFLLDRQKALRTSVFLWLPTAWFLIVASRPVSVWLAGPSPGGMTVEAALDGNSTDAAVFAGLLAAGLIVLLGRRRQAGALIGANPAILIYFVYCLASVLWSPFPDVASKRWIKGLGDLVMVFVVLTDAHPVEAVRRWLYRSGAILLPASLYLIRYTEMGRGYDPDGRPMNTGVTTNKNTLGLVAFVVGLSVVWSTWALFRAKDEPDRGRRLLARSGLLACVVAVLATAQSATAMVCFVVGSTLIIVGSLSVSRRRPAAVHAGMFAFALVGGMSILFGWKDALLRALGRDPNLTGRTEIWSVVINLAENSLIGTGFESFWNSRIETLQTQAGVYMFHNINSAHNGYIDLYLNLGLVGVFLVAVILITGYVRASAALRRTPGVAGLWLAYVVTAAFYSVTEAGFRILSPAWICLLMAVVAGSGVLAESVTVAPEHGERTDRTSEPPLSRKIAATWRPRTVRT